MEKLKAKWINLNNALQRLKEAVEEYKQENASDVIRDGVIQRFEFIYEQSWKTMKVYLESIGIVDRNSPKAVIKEAYAQKMISHEDNWLLMMNDRNLTSLVYNEEMAEEIAQRITDCYIKEFEQLLPKIKY